MLLQGFFLSSHGFDCVDSIRNSSSDEKKQDMPSFAMMRDDDEELVVGIWLPEQITKSKTFEAKMVSFII